MTYTITRPVSQYGGNVGESTLMIVCETESIHHGKLMFRQYFQTHGFNSLDFETPGEALRYIQEKKVLGDLPLYLYELENEDYAILAPSNNGQGQLYQWATLELNRPLEVSDRYKEQAHHEQA